MSQIKLPTTNNGHDELQAALQRRLKNMGSNQEAGIATGQVHSGQHSPCSPGKESSVSGNNHFRTKPVPKERNFSRNQDAMPIPSSSYLDKKQCLPVPTPTKPKPQISAKPVVDLSDLKAGKGRGKKPSIKPRPSLRKLKRQSSVSGRKNSSGTSRSPVSPSSPIKDNRKLTVVEIGQTSHNSSEAECSDSSVKVNKQPDLKCPSFGESVGSQRHNRIVEQYEDVEFINGKFQCVYTGETAAEVPNVCIPHRPHRPKLLHKKRQSKTHTVISTKAKKRSSRGSARNSRDKVDGYSSDANRKDACEWETDSDDYEHMKSPSSIKRSDSGYEPVHITLGKPVISASPVFYLPENTANPNTSTCSPRKASGATTDVSQTQTAIKKPFPVKPPLQPRPHKVLPSSQSERLQEPPHPHHRKVSDSCVPAARKTPPPPPPKRERSGCKPQENVTGSETNLLSICALDTERRRSSSASEIESKAIFRKSKSGGDTCDMDTMDTDQVVRPKRPPRPNSSFISQSDTCDDKENLTSITKPKCLPKVPTDPAFGPKKPPREKEVGLIRKPSKKLPPPPNSGEAKDNKPPPPPCRTPSTFIKRKPSDLQLPNSPRRSPPKRQDVDSDPYMDPFTELASHPSRDRSIKAQSSHRRQGSMFEYEPIYQVYHKDAVSRDMIPVSDTGASADDGIYDDAESASPISKTSSTRSLASLAEINMGMRTLWSEIPEIIESGILDHISEEERKLKEAIFEVITSEASYYKSLNILVNHFYNAHEFQNTAVLTKRDKHILFSNVLAVQAVCKKLLQEYEDLLCEDLFMSFDFYDMLAKYAEEEFKEYVTYCRNQVFQERKLKELVGTNAAFAAALQTLERSPVCQSQTMSSYLILPMQRITRLPLLLDAVSHRMNTKSAEYPSVIKCVQALNKIVKLCNEEAKRMAEMEEVADISKKLEFKSIKTFPIVSKSRYLIKSGPLTRINLESSGILSRKQETLQFYLFNDLIVVCKKRSENQYQVIDYASRISVEAELVTVDNFHGRIPPNIVRDNKNLIVMALLENHEKKTSEYILSCKCTSEATRWVEGVKPPSYENEDERIYEAWDCPQVQAIHPYAATQSDELSLEESDIINVFRKMADGWYEGERIRDGQRGWFPSNHTSEILSHHLRAKNLRQRYRLLTLAGRPVTQLSDIN